jgi:8-oxo-dGTP pyrophosphatase MutT (NUDIX family)
VGNARPAFAIGIDHRHQVNVAFPPADLRAAVTDNLQRFERIESKESLVHAAVALVLVRARDGSPCVPLFLRAANLARHAGQMGLPGGKLHAGERAEKGALRELREELGLHVELDGVLGSLDDFDTRSGFTITPVVVWGAADAADLEPSAAEVAQLYLVTLDELRSAVAVTAPGTSSDFCLRMEWGEVYAPTAAILYQFSQVALEGRTQRVNDFYQPPFTHR